MRKSDGECHRSSNQPGHTADFSSVRTRRLHPKVSSTLDSFRSVTSPQCSLHLGPGEYVSAGLEIPTSECKLSANKVKTSQPLDRQEGVIPAFPGQPGPCALQDLAEVVHTPKLASAPGPRNCPGTPSVLSTSSEDVTHGMPVTPLTDTLRDFFSRQATLRSSMDFPMQCLSVDSLRTIACTVCSDDTAGPTLPRPVHAALAETLSPDHSSCSAAPRVGFQSPLHQRIIGGLDFDAAAAPDCSDSHHDAQDLETGVNHVRQMYPQLFESKIRTRDVGQPSPSGKHTMQECTVASPVLGLCTNCDTQLLLACDQPEPAGTHSQAGVPRGLIRPDIDSIACDFKVTSPLGTSTATQVCEAPITAACNIRESGCSTFEFCVSGLSDRAQKILHRTVRVEGHENGDFSGWHHMGCEYLVSACHDSETSIQRVLRRAGVSQNTIDLIVASHG